jgi:hypothetical protein
MNKARMKREKYSVRKLLVGGLIPPAMMMTDLTD